MARGHIDVANWNELSELLDRALDLPEAQRRSWLDTLAARHAALRPRLAELLARAPSVETADFLARLPRISGEFALRSTRGASEGETVGPYRLVRELGAGGMGSVWLAERVDRLIDRPVALKLPHLLMPRAGLAERMAREREILAQLNHPNIASMYGAGISAQGQPYLALEYVEGRPIDEFCRERALDLRARLELFAQVGSAVAHAHAKLIVHRDLKPSNILVSADGRVRLLDFGIAKLLDDGAAARSPLTEMAGRAFTPDYASPEQILGEPQAVASDVYSLGVIFYELLTGMRPYKLERNSRGALEQAVLEVEPARPSDVVATPRRRALRGDLDIIALKALKKRPEDRYATVNAFVEDVHRHRDHRPLLARPDSAAYVLRKFIARNRVIVATASAMLAVIIATAALAVWQAREARVQRNAALGEQQRANAEAEAARRSARIAEAQANLSNYLTADLAVGRSTSDVEKQIDRAIAFVKRRYGDDPGVRLELLTALAARYRQTGDVARFVQMLDEIEPEASALGNEDVLARVRCSRAREMSLAGRIAEARALVNRETTKLRQRSPPTEVMGFCLSTVSSIERAAGNSAGALAAIEEVRRIEVAAGLEKTDIHAETLFVVARAYQQAGRYREADAAAAASARIHAAAGFDDSSSMANTQLIRGRIVREGGRPDRALAIFDTELAHHERRGGNSAAMQVLQWDRSAALLLLGRADAALPVARAALDDAMRRKDTGTARMAAATVVDVLVETQQFEPAARAMDLATGLYSSARKEGAYTARNFLFARTRYALAIGDFAMATEAIQETRGILDKLGNPADPAWREFNECSARLALRQQRYADARRAAGEALRLAESQALDPGTSVFIAEDLALRAAASRGLNEVAAARADAQRALDIYRKVAATGRAGYGAATLLAQTGP